LRIEPLARHADARGVLMKVFPHPVAGEVYLVTLLPGASRGHHIHLATSEWFAGIEGDPLLVVFDPATGARRALPLAGFRVLVPAGIAHALFSRGSAPSLVAAAMDRLHDPKDVVPCPLEAP
jgi:oxalate decarboxylase/phosphoglucose isomerase-like protein (cupin superfamily)